MNYTYSKSNYVVDYLKKKKDCYCFSGNVACFFNFDSMNSTGFSSEEDAPAPRHRKRTYMNQPHLRFEITSDDGFSVKANSIEGKNCLFTICL